MNVINGNIDQLVRAGPYLPGNDSTLIARIKPLYEVSEVETTIYTQMIGLGFQEGECPYSLGASTSAYKTLIYGLEEKFPGATTKFLQRFHKIILPPLKAYYQGPEGVTLNRCIKCEGPTTEQICAFCNIKYLLTGNE
jgi:uncharacterized protein (TIGR00269 family)